MQKPESIGDFLSSIKTKMGKVYEAGEIVQKEVRERARFLLKNYVLGQEKDLRLFLNAMGVYFFQ